MPRPTQGSFGDATVSPALLPTSGGRAIAGYSPRGRARAEGQGWWRHPSLPRPIALFRELSSARAAGDGNPRAGKAAVALPAVRRPHGAARGGRRMGAEHACRGAPAPLRHAAARGRWRHQALDPRSSECAPPALTTHHTDRRGAPGQDTAAPSHSACGDCLVWAVRPPGGPPVPVLCLKRLTDAGLRRSQAHERIRR